MRLFLFFVTLLFALSYSQVLLAEESAEVSLITMPESVRTLKTERTFVFTRTQAKYSLEKNFYLNVWLDRPLFVNPELRDDTVNAIGLSYPSFLKTWEVIGQYGLDGIAFFPETSGRIALYDLVNQATSDGKEGGLQLLTEFVGSPGTGKKAYKNIELKTRVLQTALRNPNAFRIGEKLVVTSYNVQSIPLEKWQETLATLRKEVDDTFLFLPALTRFGDYTLDVWRNQYETGTLKQEAIEKAKEDLRAWLRISDGLYFASSAMMRTSDRRFNKDFYTNFVIRLMKSVLSESEFQNKYFGLSAAVGHENPYLGLTQSSDGTKTLRHSIEAAIAAEPEVINIPEWDEQNENTSLRPTVYNGTSSLRILRYYTAKLKHEKLTPLANDNTAIPNLIVSYRKMLTLGEKLEVEILNVPDSPRIETLTIRLVLSDPDGKEIYRSQALTLDSDKLEDRTEVIPTETLKDYPVLIPYLEIASGDQQWKFSEGLHYIYIRATSNWDYKWVKQPLRDLLEPVKSELSTTPSEDGGQMITAQFEAKEALAYVEILDNDNVVYSHSEEDTWRENADQIILSLYWHAPSSNSQPVEIAGDITLEGAEGRWLIPSEKNAPILKENTLSHITASSSKPRRILVAIPRNAVEQARLNIRFPDVFEGTIPVSQILKDAMFGIAGANRFDFVISHYLGQYAMPLHLKKNAAAFTIPILQESPRSVLHLQALGESGRLYRSRPIRIGTATGKTGKITVFSDSRERSVELEVDASRVPDLRYHFDARYGSVFYTDAGQAYRGILGGSSVLTTERGGGQSGDGNPFYSADAYPKDATESAPKWVEENGETGLRFDGEGTFVTLPQSVIPRRAGYHISLDIRPERPSAREVILANRASYPGSLTVYRENGILKVDFLAQNGTSLNGEYTGLRLPSGEWSHLDIYYDQERLLLAVNGEFGRSIPIAGPGIYDMVSVLGGYGQDWFKGDIKRLDIQHNTGTPLTEK